MPKKAKKKIRIFVDGEVLVLSHFSGIGHYTAALLKAVDELLFEEEFSHISLEIGVPWRMRRTIGKFGYQNFAIRKMITSPRISNGLKKKHRLPPIDLLFGKKTYVFPNYSSWPTLNSKSIPIIYDASFILYPEHSDDENCKFLTTQTQLSADRSERVITISQNSKREIQQYFGKPSSKIDVVYPVLDTDKFYRRSTDEIANIKAKFGIFGDYILYVGNLEPRKNLVTLLKAYRELDPALQKKYSLLLIGAKGWKDEEITSLIIGMRKENIRVIQPTDYVDDVDLPALFSGATIFTYVSVYEGFGIPPTEAMACGTPAISTFNSSLPEAVGDAAMHVDAYDVSQITNAMEKLLTDEKLRASYVEKGYDHIRKFNTREIAVNFIRSIEDANK